MPSERRFHPFHRREPERRESARQGEGRGPRTSPERRFVSDWEGAAEPDFEGERSYPVAGYPLETRDPRSQCFDEERDLRASRDAYGEPADSYREFAEYWPDSREVPDYFGVGVHYGGGFGSAPGSRASAAGSLGAPGYAGMGVFDEDSDWLPDSSFTGPEFEHEPQPSYRGLGPKGYERTDELLREIVCERLTEHPCIDASDVQVEVADKVVTVSGEVEDRRIKYAIEDVIAGCAGVKDVDNRLRVKSGRRSGG